MTGITVIGAGAFGTALAIALGRAGRSVRLVARNAEQAAAIGAARENRARLPGHALPQTVAVTAEPGRMAPICLLAVPTQALGGVVAALGPKLEGVQAVACCKGVDLQTGLGPTGVIARSAPGAEPAILSGPGFAADIAAGLPTALTVAAADEACAARLQLALTTTTLRLYRSTDMAGVELGGALKNVIAIAAGICIGAGLGESARAALMTRGFAEMKRLAGAFGAESETLSGLSGLGDLVLTCTSEKSRNFRHGLALGAGRALAGGETVEGVTTARAVAELAARRSLDLPLTATVDALLSGRIGVRQAVDMLLSRPLKKE